ncbi:uncharacterized protein LOC115060076 [Echeneis naucrates]|uniref:Uncharacterized LOC115060076 n=1 Tax=Echeneis naucrates TaxID=173247 RepID=A0A665UXH9_ECHNA|nr:uncharacterized protein LOC115060076 [Echeneis naucrates]
MSCHFSFVTILASCMFSVCAILSMGGRKYLLLMAVSLLLERCLQEPNVEMLPRLKNVFIGDTFYLKCDRSASGSEVKWYFKNAELNVTNEVWKITVASSQHSGAYQCESNTQKSKSFNINVIGFMPIASLEIMTGYPVMHTGNSVILSLENEHGLQGWRCWVYRKAKDEIKRLKLSLKENTTEAFQTSPLTVPETIFWCTDELQEKRSNQIIVRTSSKPVSVEMKPFPAVIGQTLTLMCVVWGTNQITNTNFYKEKRILKQIPGPLFTIQNVTEATKGQYRCIASYTYIHSKEKSYRNESDFQDLPIQENPISAKLVVGADMACSCSQCGSNTAYYYYYRKDDTQKWEPMGTYSNNMTPKKSGYYACRAVLSMGRSNFSASHYHDSNANIRIITVVVVLLLIGILLIGLLFYYYKKRSTPDQIYEEMPLGSQNERYEILQRKHGAKMESEYDMLHSQEPGQEKKGDEYVALKKGEINEEEYHNLEGEGAAAGGGAYEALKKEGMSAELYQTLGGEGAAAGGGGYEALKKGGMSAELYQTLGGEGAAAGGGGYEALKKDRNDGIYNTLEEKKDEQRGDTKQ